MLTFNMYEIGKPSLSVNGKIRVIDCASRHRSSLGNDVVCRRFKYGIDIGI